jgi:hypothetical protein
MTQSRKDAIRAYKERKPERGIFAIRCGATGSVWVDSAMDLEMSEQRTWSLLRNCDPQADKAAVAEFRQHGQQAYTYEVLEKLDKDVAEISVRDSLKDKKKHWLSQLSARPLWPV